MVRSPQSGCSLRPPSRSGLPFRWRRCPKNWGALQRQTASPRSPGGAAALRAYALRQQSARLSVAFSNSARSRRRVISPTWAAKASISFPRSPQLSPMTSMKHSTVSSMAALTVVMTLEPSSSAPLFRRFRSVVERSQIDRPCRRVARTSGAARRRACWSDVQSEGCGPGPRESPAPARLLARHAGVLGDDCRFDGHRPLRPRRKPSAVRARLSLPRLRAS